jgi:hypothetical protein
MTNEIWRDVVGFEGRYAVSNLGRVKSLAREVAQKSRSGNAYTRTVPERILRPGPKWSGHVSVALGRGNSRDVHVLVAEAFHGPRPAGHEVRHLDGDPANNHASNLVWGTRGDNGRDKKWHPAPHGYKLRPPQIQEIKRSLSCGETGAALSRRFGVSQSTVSAIKHGRTHTDVRA